MCEEDEHCAPLHVGRAWMKARGWEMERVASSTEVCVVGQQQMFVACGPQHSAGAHMHQCVQQLQALFLSQCHGGKPMSSR